jgi:predicted phosphodiesterase
MVLVSLMGFKAQAQDVKICVIADIHYFDPSLLVNDGSAFQTYLAYDRKLLRESEAILESVIDSLISEKPDMVIVAGDLTKDGEKSGHENVAAYFKQLEDAGIEVIVTPGNHDINNPSAVSFNGANVAPVPSVSPEEFAQIYAANGYNQAIATDTASLSFVYNFNDKVTVISMDGCIYENNYINEHSTTAGEFKPDVLKWIVEQTTLAKADNRQVFGVMHHGLVEHYTGQKAMFSEYVINNWDSISNVLANAGMNIVFTGHYHAQDAALKTTEEGNFVFDIETGSTVTYPCPYRIITLSEDNKLSVKGKRVQDIDYELGEMDFQAYALNFIETGLPVLVKGMLMMEPYYLNDSMASLIEPAITESFIAHYAGDEGEPSPETQAIIEVLKADQDYYAIGYILQAIWNDPDPSDWEIEIDLENTIGVNEKLFNTKLKVYPNPSNGLVSISGEFTSNAQLRIYDLLGKLKFQSTLYNVENTIDTQLPSGIYLFEINSDGLTFKKKIIIK